MSTEIAKIEGSYHKRITSTYKVIEGKSDIHVTRFWGGVERGRMIQITISNPESTSYIHLTHNQCNELADILSNCFDNTKYPSE